MRKTVSLLWQGFRFGMLLQLAVGPVCLMVLNTSVTQGVLRTFSMILAITLADAFYIALSLLGASALLQKPSVRRVAGLLGGFVLVIFGVDLASSALGSPLLPGINLFSAHKEGNLFWQGLLLTLSNPLTILFWGGVLTGQVLENRWDRLQLVLFACGCVLSTLLFLSAVSAVGGIFSSHIPHSVIQGLNIAVGFVLAIFGVRMALHARAPKQTQN